MKTTKALILTIASLVLLTGTPGLQTETAHAAYSPVSRNLCTLMVKPFDITKPAILGSGGNVYINYLNSVCKSFVTYPNAYSPQPPNKGSNPVKSNATDKHLPITKHTHIYYNDTVHDTYFYYRAFMDRFEITLESDGYNSIDINNIKCQTPYPSGYNTANLLQIEDCQGTISDLWGGTTVSKQQVGNNVRITWDFGQTNQNGSYKGRPTIWANNGASFPEGNFTNENMRKLGFDVHLPSKDNDEIWSATTSSRALIADLAIRKSNYPANKTKGCAAGGVNDPNSGWCYLNPISGYQTETVYTSSNKTFYWFPIGSVATVWQESTPQPPAACADLTLSISQDGNTYSPGNLNGLEPNQPMSMTVTPTFDPSNQTVPLEYQWTGTHNAQAEGFFKDFSSATQQNNPFTDNDTGVYYSGGAAGTTVAVIALDQGVPQSQCQVEFVIPDTPQKPVCVGVNLTPNTLTAPGSNPYTATVQFSDGQTYNTTVEWTGNGTFTNGNTQSGSTNSFQNTFNTSATTASVNVKVTNLPPTVDNSPACQQGATVTSTDEGMCVALTANYTTPVEAGDVIFLDPNVIYSGNVLPSQIQWQETGDGFFRDFLTNQIQPSSFTAPYTSAYFYHAVTQGDSFTLTAIPNPTNNPACTLSETVVQPPDQNEECDYLDFDIQNDQICIDVDPDYNGRFEWTIGNTTFTENSANCQAYTEDLSYEVVGIDAINPAICSDKLQPKDNDCDYFDFTFPGDQICIDTDYNGEVEWTINGNTETADDDECFPYNPGYSYEADAVNTNNPVCRDEVQPDTPELTKEARRGGGTTHSMDVLTLRADDATVDYKLTYTPLTNQKYSTFITDTISKGYIEAILLPGGNGVEPGRIEYNNDMEVWVGAHEIHNCLDLPEGAEIEDCYAGDIGNGGVRLIRVMGTATIFYSGSVDSALKDEVCQDGQICQEKYLNSAETNNSVIHVDEDEFDVPEVTSNEIKAQIFCQYILTRAAGDIFLENDLSTGVDISICSKYRSSTGIIITPGDEETPPLVSTGPGEATIKAIGHEVCTAGQAGTVSNELAELYGSGVSGLSSQICEVKLRTGSPWKQEVITNSIDENKTRASRWGAESLGTVLSNILSAYKDQNVYHLKGDVTSGNIRMDEIGAKTFIIEDGDLYIDQDIVYTGTCPAGPNQCSVRDVASLAFIVLNGSVYVDPSVENISGVFFVQEGDRDGSGRLFSGTGLSNNNARSDLQLKVFGSVYGDIDPLFEQRFFSGDPGSDLGGIVVRFDQRVILNTPPGLRDILNVSQTEVAR